MKLLTPFKLLVLAALLLCTLPANAWRETGLHAIDASETSLTLSTYSLELYLNAYGDVQVESGSGSYEIINMNPDIVETEFISDGVANAKAQTPTQEGSKIDDLLSIKGIALGDAVVRVKDKNTQEVAEVKVHVGTAPHLSLSSYSQTLEVGKRVEVEVLTGSRMYQVNSNNNDIVKAVSFTRSSGRIGPDGEPVYETHDMIEISAKTAGVAIVNVKDLSSGEVAEIAVTVKNDTPASPAISFADPEVERICVENWDTDGDGKLSEKEAESVTWLSWMFFSGKPITTFDELTYFKNLRTIGQAAFGQCRNLKSVKIPKSVTEIGMSAFADCISLVSIDIPKGVTEIQNWAFENCQSLTSISLPEGVTTLKEKAFYGCTGLKTITIPSTIQEIGNYVFYGLSSIQDVYCYATVVPQVTANSFSNDMAANTNLPNATLHVPVGCVDAYRNAQGWNVFNNIVEFEVDGAPANVEAVDLGLPSGTRWANMNMGAFSPEEYGGYYSWGETEVKDYYDWSNYSHCDGSAETCQTLDGNICGTEFDVAHVKWGGNWRMPTLDEMGELVENCEHSLTTLNSVQVMKLTGPNGNSIYLPFTGYMKGTERKSIGYESGYYWSGTNPYVPHTTPCLVPSSNGNIFHDYFQWDKYLGLAVRPVMSPVNMTIDCDTLDFGKVDLGQDKSLSFTITNLCDSTVWIEDFSNTHLDFSLSWSAGAIPAHGSQKVKVTYTPTYVSRNVNAWLLIGSKEMLARDEGIKVIMNASSMDSNFKARTHLVILCKDSTKFAFGLNEMPLLAHKDGKLMVTSATTASEIELSKILKITYASENESMGIQEISSETNAPFVREGASLIFYPNGKEQRVKIITIGGIVAREFTIPADQPVKFSLSTLKPDVYIISLNSTTYKMILR